MGGEVPTWTDGEEDDDHKGAGDGEVFQPVFLLLQPSNRLLREPVAHATAIMVIGYPTC